jgi:hypothetical protein
MIADKANGPERGMQARALLLLTLALGGCSASGVVTDWISDDAAGPEPFNYRFEVAKSLDGIIGAGERNVSELEIAAPRRVDVVKGAAWLVCLKARHTTARRPPAYYGIFIQREKIVESRLAVGTDMCDSQPYMPLDWRTETDRSVVR